jgi:hypothetical protein
MWREREAEIAQRRKAEKERKQQEVAAQRQAEVERRREAEEEDRQRAAEEVEAKFEAEARRKADDEAAARASFSSLSALQKRDLQKTEEERPKRGEEEVDRLHAWRAPAAFEERRRLRKLFIISGIGISVAVATIAFLYLTSIDRLFPLTDCAYVTRTQSPLRLWWSNAPVAIIIPDDEQYKNIAQTAQQRASLWGWNISILQYPPSTTDFSQYIERLRAVRPKRYIFCGMARFDTFQKQAAGVDFLVSLD